MSVDFFFGANHENANFKLYLPCMGMSSYALSLPMALIDNIPLLKSFALSVLHIARLALVGMLDFTTALGQGLLWVYTQSWPWFLWPFLYFITLMLLIPAYFLAWTSYLLDCPLPTLYLPLSPVKVLQVSIYKLQWMTSFIQGQRLWFWCNKFLPLTPTSSETKKYLKRWLEQNLNGLQLKE